MQRCKGEAGNHRRVWRHQPWTSPLVLAAHPQGSEPGEGREPLSPNSRSLIAWLWVLLRLAQGCRPEGGAPGSRGSSTPSLTRSVQGLVLPGRFTRGSYLRDRWRAGSFCVGDLQLLQLGDEVRGFRWRTEPVCHHVQPWPSDRDRRSTRPRCAIVVTCGSPPARVVGPKSWCRSSAPILQRSVT